MDMWFATSLPEVFTQKHSSQDRRTQYKTTTVHSPNAATKLALRAVIDQPTIQISSTKKCLSGS